MDLSDIARIISARRAAKNEIIDRRRRFKKMKHKIIENVGWGYTNFTVANFGSYNEMDEDILRWLQKHGFHVEHIARSEYDGYTISWN